MSNTLKLGNGQWATGKDTVLAYNDLNSNYKPLPFSFSRDTSATVVNKDGLIETVGSGEPRIDYKDNTKGALLLEPTRSNAITYSEDFSQSVWVKSGTSVVSGFISPDGTENAYKLVESSANQAHTITSNAGSVSSGATTTKSIIVKPNGRRWILLLDIYKPGSRAWFDLELGVVGSRQSSVISSKIEKLSNGYFRCSVASTVNGTSSQLRMDIVTDNNITSGYQGDGTSGVYIYGAQLEQGSYATSYIPTSGGAVTRLREEANNQNNLMSGLTDIAMFVDYELPNGNSSGFRNQLGFRDDDNANFYMIQFPNSNTHEFRYTGVANVNVDMTPSMSEQDFGLRRKLLYTKTGTTLKVFCNGIQVSTVTSASATTFSTTSEILNVGENYDAEMKIKDWKLYNNGFTDAEAITLTTI
jgi:hypothetical protein